MMGLIPSGKIRLLSLVGASVALLLTTVILFAPYLFQPLDFYAYDSLLSLRSNRQNATATVIVDVDETSLSEVGQWPWPRRDIARLVEKLTEAGARSIALDFLFAETERPYTLASAGTAPPQSAGPIGENPPQAPESQFANVLARSPSVIGMWFIFAPGMIASPPELASSSIAYRSRGNTLAAPPIPQAYSVISPTADIRGAATAFGFINALPDADGKIRRLPLLIQFNNQTYPSLALAAVCSPPSGGGIVVERDNQAISQIAYGDHSIRTDRNGFIRLPFAQNDSHRFTTLSASDILAGAFSKSDIEGKVVVVGSSAVGLFDFHPTPLNRSMPGLLIQAIAIEGIDAHLEILDPHWGLLFSILSVFLCAFIALWIFHLFHAVWSVTITSLMICIVWILAFASLDVLHTWISPVPATLSLSITMLSLGLIQFQREEQTALRHAGDRIRAQNCAMSALAAITEARDPETGSHVFRTQHYVLILANKLRNHPRFRHELTRQNIDVIAKSAPLHDIGKVGVPDDILLKPGKLTEEEFAVMKRHTEYGHDALERAQQISGIEGTHGFLSYASEITLSHHEKWDGSGYPHGLAGDAIPISARLMALADVYDALRSARPYKAGFSHQKSAEIIREGSGTHFDADVVWAFTELEVEFQEIWNRFLEIE